MSRVVVVASSEVPEEALSEVISAEDDVRIVMAAVHQSRLRWLVSDEDKARAEAQEVGEAIAEAAPADPSTIQVKPDLPSQVVLDAIAEHTPDKIVVALREGEEATWLEKGELEELPQEIDGIPVIHVSV
jgi:nucleotide-binding universal stress UspA family protein